MDRFHRVNLHQSLGNQNVSGLFWKPMQLGRTVAILANPVGRRISNEYHHLTRVLPPVHVQRLCQGSRDGFGSVTAARGIEP